MRGEFGLIEQIKNWVSGFQRKDTLLALGDDTAVLPYSKTEFLLLSCDTLVEDSHFKLKKVKPGFLGAKSLMVNISDILAMGGTAQFALVSLALPKNISSRWVGKFYAGMQKIARRFNVQIVGGDTVASPGQVMITVTILGRVDKNKILYRSKAKVGDLIAVSGAFGLAAFKKFRVLPPVRIKEVRVIGDKQLASAMIDSSDGLVASIHQICKASRVGARLDLSKVPVAKGAELEAALYGGEDYELVFTVPRSKVKQLKGFRIVGKIVNQKQGFRLVTAQGKEFLPKAGFDHFKRS